MNKLLKLSENHYIIVDDSEIKDGELAYDIDLKRVFNAHKNLNLKHHKKVFKKITHSSQPLEQSCCTPKGQIERYLDCKGSDRKQLNFVNIKPLSLSEIEKLINSYSVEEMFEDAYGVPLNQNATIRKEGYQEGFEAHQELVKDKLFTRKQLIDFTEKCMIIANETDNVGRLRRFISQQADSLLPQTEWDVKYNDQGKLELV